MNSDKTDQFNAEPVQNELNLGENKDFERVTQNRRSGANTGLLDSFALFLARVSQKILDRHNKTPNYADDVAEQIVITPLAEVETERAEPVVAPVYTNNDINLNNQATTNTTKPIFHGKGLAKYRRLIIVLAIIALLILCFFMFKSNKNEVVEPINDGIPIEYYTLEQTISESPETEVNQELDDVINNILANQDAEPSIYPTANIESLDIPEMKAEQNVAAIPATTNVSSSQSNKQLETQTLVIAKGKSLMQLFRDHQLPVSDLMAMTKAQGTSKALDKFNAGDKVQVKVHRSGAKSTVDELHLANGWYFVRQANGSYILHK